MSPERSKAELVQDTKAGQQELQALKRQVEHQRLVLRAVWEMLHERLGWSEADLAATVKKIEASVRSYVAKPCPKCARSLQSRSSICIYCGAEVEDRELL